MDALINFVNENIGLVPAVLFLCLIYLVDNIRSKRKKKAEESMRLIEKQRQEILEEEARLEEARLEQEKLRQAQEEYIKAMIKNIHNIKTQFGTKLDRPLDIKAYIEEFRRKFDLIRIGKPLYSLTSDLAQGNRTARYDAAGLADKSGSDRYDEMPDDKLFEWRVAQLEMILTIQSYMDWYDRGIKQSRAKLESAGSIGEVELIKLDIQKYGEYIQEAQYSIYYLMQAMEDRFDLLKEDDYPLVEISIEKDWLRQGFSILKSEGVNVNPVFDIYLEDEAHEVVAA